jgi:hypothetical protein
LRAKKSSERGYAAVFITSAKQILTLFSVKKPEKGFGRSRTIFAVYRSVLMKNRSVFAWPGREFICTLHCRPARFVIREVCTDVIR